MIRCKSYRSKTQDASYSPRKDGGHRVKQNQLYFQYVTLEFYGWDSVGYLLFFFGTLRSWPPSDLRPSVAMKCTSLSWLMLFHLHARPSELRYHPAKTFEGAKLLSQIYPVQWKHHDPVGAAFLSSLHRRPFTKMVKFLPAELEKNVNDCADTK